jgi:phosphatidylglycerol---prolipoprotein diacylglyceryl transferase
VRLAWHSIFSFAGLVVGSAVSIRCARFLVRDERVYPFALAVILGGLLSARLGHIVDNWPVYAGRPDQLVAFWNGGLAVTAAPVGASIAGLIAARALALPIGFMFDISVIGIVLGEAIGRVGDVINGEHHAVACSGLPWCVRYTAAGTLGQRESVHPVAAYDLLIDLALFAILLWAWRRVRVRSPEGRVYLVYTALYGAARVVSSSLRLDPVVIAGWQEAQLLGVAYVLAATLVVIWYATART